MESVLIELLTSRLGLAPLVIAGSSIMIAGAALIAISIFIQRQKTASIFRAWKYLIPASILLSAGIFFWYDSVTNVGASKEGLLAGPLEVIIILVLARIILREKLGGMQLLGAVVALAGFLATVLSAESMNLLLTWGDFEAVISAAAFGTGIIFATRLTNDHSPLQVTGASLFISGIILGAILWIDPPIIMPADWAALLAFSVVPLAAGLSYVVGLARIGASMTSTIASFSILLTVLFQLAMHALGFDVMLPSNIALAVAGGALGILGIYLIHREAN